MADSKVNVIVGLVDKTKQGAKSVKSSLDSIKQSVTALIVKYGLLTAAFLTFVGAIKGGISIIRSYVDAANIQQRAELKLATTLKTLSGGTQEQTDALIKQAGALQNLTGYGDEATISAQAMLATFALNAEQIAELTPRLLDMAEGQRRMGKTSIDLEQVSTAVGKALSSNIGGLSKMGVTMSEAQKEAFNLADQQERVALLAEILDQNYKGLAETVGGSFEGAIRKAEDAAGDLDEVIGMQITNNEAAKDAVDSVTAAYVEMQGGILENSDAVAATIKFFIGLFVGGFNTVRAAINVTQIAFGGLALGIITQIELIARGLAKVTFGDVSENFENLANELNAVSGSLKEGIKDDFEELKDSGKAIAKPYESLKQESEDTAETIAEAAKKGTKAYEKMAAKMEADFKEVQKALDLNAETGQQNLERDLKIQQQQLDAKLAAIDASNVSEEQKNEQKNALILEANRQTLAQTVGQLNANLVAIESIYAQEIAKFDGVKAKQQQLEQELGQKRKAILLEVENAHESSIGSLLSLEKKYADQAVRYRQKIADNERSLADRLAALQQQGLQGSALIEAKKQQLAQKTAEVKAALARGDFELADKLSQEQLNLATDIASTAKSNAADAKSFSLEDLKARTAARQAESDLIKLSKERSVILAQAAKAKDAEAAKVGEQARAQQDELGKLREKIQQLNAALSDKNVAINVDSSEIEKAKTQIKELKLSEYITKIAVDTNELESAKTQIEELEQKKTKAKKTIYQASVDGKAVSFGDNATKVEDAARTNRPPSVNPQLSEYITKIAVDTSELEKAKAQIEELEQKKTKAKKTIYQASVDGKAVSFGDNATRVEDAAKTNRPPSVNPQLTEYIGKLAQQLKPLTLPDLSKVQQSNTQQGGDEKVLGVYKLELASPAGKVDATIKASDKEVFEAYERYARSRGRTTREGY